MVKVLYVDWDAQAGAWVRSVLAGVGIECLLESRGGRVCEVLKQSGASAVLMEVMLPEVSGFETCRRVRADRDHRQTGNGLGPHPREQRQGFRHPDLRRPEGDGGEKQCQGHVDPAYEGSPDQPAGPVDTHRRTQPPCRARERTASRKSPGKTSRE